MSPLRRVAAIWRGRPRWFDWLVVFSIILGTAAAQVAPCTSCWGVNP